jgi:hypothetical protein
MHTEFVRKPDEKRLFGKPSNRWEANSKMDLQEIICADSFGSGFSCGML